MIPRDRITLGILAGGQGRRLGGVDKAFASYRGRPLIERCLQACGDGFAERLVSHPGDVRFGSPQIRAIPDFRSGRLGPLSGLESLLRACRSDWLLSLPVDLRAIPDGFVDTLCRQANDQGTVVRDADGLQPLCGLWRVTQALPVISARLDRGALAAQGLLDDLILPVHDISPLRLGNLNTPDDFLDSDA